MAITLRISVKNADREKKSCDYPHQCHQFVEKLLRIMFRHV